MNLALRPRVRRVWAIAHSTLTAGQHRSAKLRFVKPCYWICDSLGPQSTILDFGLGFDADFSQAMIAQYGCTSHGFDPTAKHQDALQAVARATGDKLRVHCAAVGAKAGRATFHESVRNVSGSLLDEHPNVRRDEVRTYEVEMMTLQQALDAAAPATPDLVKMDIEGAEYDVLEAAPDAALGAVGQWVVEFHHHLIPGIPYGRTAAMLRRFRSLGFRDYTRDGVNFLLYRPANRAAG